MTKAEFLAWAVPEIEAWELKHEDRWSIDRCDNRGHYELGNLKLVALADNCRKKSNNRNYKAAPGKAWCSRCRDYKPRGDFHRAKARANGLSQYCKGCVKAKKTKCSP